MASPQVVDTASRARQIDEFLKQATVEKHVNAAESAQSAKKKVTDDLARPVGKIISHTFFQFAVTRLAQGTATLIFEDSIAYPDQCGIYVRDASANLDDLNPRNRGRRFVTGMCNGMMPENTQWDDSVDEYGEPQPHITRKGWRDTLKVLIQMRLVSLEAVERVFGSGGKNWHRQLH